MTRRDLHLLMVGIFPSQEKDGDIEWWSEKGERGGRDRASISEILCVTEEKYVARKRKMRYEKRGRIRWRKRRNNWRRSR